MGRERARAGDLGITIGRYAPGRHNAITDVAGVRVGHATLDDGPARTGVTIVWPVDNPWATPVYAGTHRLNGNGEITGLEWLRESGMLTSGVALTNTHSVGVVRDALVAYEVERNRIADGQPVWFLPVVGETWDGVLNDINGFHVTAGHVRAAIEDARWGPVAEGAVGGGTGMICHGFKGGIGTASRVLQTGATVGVLVQANHGRRDRLSVDGVPVGQRIGTDDVPAPGQPSAHGAGSIIVIVATDAPLIPSQCERLARRASLGIARTGGLGENGSGDLMLCFATGNSGMSNGAGDDATPYAHAITALNNEHIDPLFEAAVDATEEAIVNALLAADTMTGVRGDVAYALDADHLARVLRSRTSG